ncbi:metabolite traffic protein EboE [Mycobacterium lacus]|uniref:Xylose isomerase n=1 Tax=Mycobacterium lacus TaxID=169765 RepID=A0A1X1Y6Q8_9MYCO|nr:metabolite traffic protein EboE [Mycobacterium lacus]MCV7125632.1 metabolite traffic protein EboE [Mycobacterium lacus]ORW06802.1 isomerase [Mycobacterium lacus]BBX96307.1 xylose isomerase [Mycobacterium lacus]
MLSYCSNVVAADNLDVLERHVLSVFAPARERAGLERLGIGLWLPGRTVGQLTGDRRARGRLAGMLADNGLAVVTMNAFPYGAFHGELVKHAVYQPDWTTPERLEYTKGCAEVLGSLMADASHGTISTLPLGWADPWDDEVNVKACHNLCRLGDVLRRIEDESGHRIRLAVEPEPGCVIGSCRDAMGWFARAVGENDVDPRYIALCLDTCHLAVMYETPADVVAGLAESGVEVVKIQASNAIEIHDLAAAGVAEAFAEFADSPYLHQVNGVDADGHEWFRDDLSLDDPSTPRSGSARVHYHVPLHARPPAPLDNTAHVLAEVMGLLRDGTIAGPVDVEIETYTWNVLPPSLRMGSLAEDIAAEIRWLDELVCVRDPA